MNRAICLTVVSMLASVAAAVATSAEPMATPRVEGQRVAAATSAPGGVAPRVHAAPRAPALLEAPPCEPDAAARYRQWHHGGLKLAPGCAAASRG